MEDYTGEIIARGPAKFMNYGDPSAGELSLDSTVALTRKEDGSLGIGWIYQGRLGIATRGSFVSDQAIRATSMLTTYDAGEISTGEGEYTPIWEIIYPDNRIVLSYGDFEGLKPLGQVDLRTGLISNRPENIYTHPGTMTLGEAILLDIPDDEEGYVLDIINVVQKMTGVHHDVVGHLKLKGERYKYLHALLTNTSARRVWVELAARACHTFIEEDKHWGSRLGHDPEDFLRVDVTKDISETLLTNVPDEFYTWVTRQIDSITDQVTDHVIQAILLAGQISHIDDKRTRYEAVKDHPMCTHILRFVDTRDESQLIVAAWKLAYPGNEIPFSTQEED